MIGTRRPNLTTKTRTGLGGSFIELSAGVTHFEVRGEGDRNVVLIHGNAAPYVTWDNTVDDLCEAGLRVLRYDVIGHGFSDRPRLRTYDRSLYNSQLAELLERLAIPYPVMIVGSSQGGSIAACFAAQNPGMVEKLGLLAPFFDEVPGSDSLLARAVRIRPIGELIFGMAGDDKLADLSNAIVSAESRKALEPLVVRQFQYGGKRRAMLANWRGNGLRDATSCYERVKEQQIPTLLTLGTLDQKLTGDSMRRLRDLLPTIEYHELEGAGHLAHYEFPEVVNPILIRFLTG